MTLFSPLFLSSLSLSSVCSLSPATLSSPLHLWGCRELHPLHLLHVWSSFQSLTLLPSTNYTSVCSLCVRNMWGERKKQAEETTTRFVYSEGKELEEHLLSYRLLRFDDSGTLTTENGEHSYPSLSLHLTSCVLPLMMNWGRRDFLTRYQIQDTRRKGFEQWAREIEWIHSFSCILFCTFSQELEVREEVRKE